MHADKRAGKLTQLQKLYLEIFRIRKIEEAIANEYPRQQMRCPTHLSIGQEASSVGICSLLVDGDLMVSTHRGHAHYLAKGGSLRGLLCELHGKGDGCGRGQAGSMHLIDRSVGFCGSTSIVGGTIPIGVGLAFAKKLRREGGIVVVCIGDAAIEEGVFHESANFASLHNLPVAFVCENNLYSCYTHIRDRQPNRGMQNIALAHDMSYYSCDGNDAFAITKHINFSKPRNGYGPIFIELETYRYHRHCGPEPDDHLNYRDENELKYWLERDPLGVTAKQLHEASEWNGITDHFLKIEDEIQFEMEYARTAKYPEQWELGAYEYKITD